MTVTVYCYQQQQTEWGVRYTTPLPGLLQQWDWWNFNSWLTKHKQATTNAVINNLFSPRPSHPVPFILVPQSSYPCPMFSHSWQSWPKCDHNYSARLSKIIRVSLAILWKTLNKSWLHPEDKQIEQFVIVFTNQPIIFRARETAECLFFPFLNWYSSI